MKYEEIESFLEKRRLLSDWLSDPNFKEGDIVVLGGFMRRIEASKNLLWVTLMEQFQISESWYEGIDQSSSLQLLFRDSDAILELKSLKKESVLLVSGKLKKRPKNQINLNQKYGEWELEVDRFFLFSKALKNLPFSAENNVGENLLMDYRYLDLRFNLQKNLIFKSYVISFLYRFLNSEKFIEINTPVLSLSSREGANTFDTYISKNGRKFSFSLSQSPQLFKQLLMISGFNRYFQFANCFRNEDLRADRQYEFIQLDLELSFSTVSQLFSLIERMITKLFEESWFSSFFQKKPEFSFTKLSYLEVMKRYGSDKPDIRMNLEIKNFSSSFPETIEEFRCSEIYGIFLEDCYQIDSCLSGDNNEIIDEKEFVKKWYLRCAEDLNLTNLDDFFKKFSIFSFCKNDELFDDSTLNREVKKFFKDKSKGLLFLLPLKEKMHDFRNLSLSEKEAWLAFGRLRNILIKNHPKEKDIRNIFKFIWITDWPLFEKSKDGNWVATHHLFTRPKSEDIDPKNTLSWGYDLVLNGVELASGSVRNSDLEVQKKIFKVVEISDQEVEENFGWFLEAFNYGVPPHLGIALGIDRFIQTLLSLSSIRNVIAFPKNSHGFCRLTKSPKELKD